MCSHVIATSPSAATLRDSLKSSNNGWLIKILYTKKRRELHLKMLQNPKAVVRNCKRKPITQRSNVPTALEEKYWLPQAKSLNMWCGYEFYNGPLCCWKSSPFIQTVTVFHFFINNIWCWHILPYSINMCWGKSVFLHHIPQCYTQKKTLRMNINWLVWQIDALETHPSAFLLNHVTPSASYAVWEICSSAAF